jgi:RNA polymerase sigma-70 factor, ECF subfamily
MEQKSDNELMALLVERNTPALGEIYRRYEVPLFNFLLRLTGSREISQELIQELFVRVWFAADSFAPREREGGFRAWLYTIALNLARDEMSRKRYAYRYVAPELADGSRCPGPDDGSPPAVLERSETFRALASALNRMRPHLREVVVLKNLQQLTFAEIARVTRVPESTVKARYSRAITELRAHLRPLEEQTDENRMLLQ